MMVNDHTLLVSKARPLLFKKPTPSKYLKEYYQHIAEKKMLYVIVIAGATNQIFIRQDNPKDFGLCYVFWRKRDAYVYASSCALSKDKTRIWETSLDDIMGFSKKINKKDQKTKGFNVIAGVFHEGVMLDVDLIWSEECQLWYN